jgi:hypothetical protein
MQLHLPAGGWVGRWVGCWLCHSREGGSPGLGPWLIKGSMGAHGPLLACCWSPGMLPVADPHSISKCIASNLNIAGRRQHAADWEGEQQQPHAGQV